MKAIIEKTSTGFSGYMEDIPGATTGATLSEMRENFEELRDLHVAYLKEQGKALQDHSESRDQACDRSPAIL